jgi:flagellar hook-associated protein 3 FlgL
MSGTLNNIYNNTCLALSLHSQAMARLQEQVSTGSRINRASDDPSAAYQVLGLDSHQRTLTNYIDNISDLSSTLEFSSTVVQDMVSALAETKTRLTQIANGTYSTQARERTAQGINDILEQMLSLANSKHMGQYIFSGADTSTEPYLAERANGEITSVTYQGSRDSREIQVAPGLKSATGYVGDNIFRANERGDSTFLGDTGAKSGTGTSSVRGDHWLTVTGSAGDYELSIDDGLSSFHTDGTDTNLAVTDSRTGEVLYVDATQITQTGTDLVRTAGTSDLFNVLVGIRDLLRNDRGLSDAQWNKLQDSLLGSLNEINDLLVQTETSIGSKIGFLDDIKNSLDNLKNNTEDESTRLQQADVAQLAIDLSRHETLYQMSLSVAGKLLSLSLLDYLQ